MRNKLKSKKMALSDLHFTWDKEASEKCKKKSHQKHQRTEAEKSKKLDLNEYFNFLEQFHVSRDELLKVTIFDQVFTL